jgi:hypothetical protein
MKNNTILSSPKEIKTNQPRKDKKNKFDEKDDSNSNLIRREKGMIPNVQDILNEHDDDRLKVHFPIENHRETSTHCLTPHHFNEWPSELKDKKETMVSISINESNVVNQEPKHSETFSKKKAEVSVSMEFLNSLRGFPYSIAGTKFKSIIASIIDQLQLKTKLHPILKSLFILDPMLFLRITKQWITNKRLDNHDVHSFW